MTRSPFESTHAKLGVHGGRWVVSGPHPAGPHGVQAGASRAADVCLPVCIRLDVWARFEPADYVAAKGILL